MRRRRSPRTLALVAALALGAITLPLVPSEIARGVPSGVFAYGVAAGEITGTSALLWTRAETADDVIIETATDPDFTTIVDSQTVTPSAADDYTLKVAVAGLDEDTEHFYRFREATGPDVSTTGRFLTLPSASAPAPLEMVFSGDANTLKDEFGDPVYGNFEPLSAAAAENPDLFVFLGDTIYSDAPEPITDLSDYRQKYKDVRDPDYYPAVQEILSATGMVVQWDDHEIVNDWNSETVDATQLANGTQAFREYNPVAGDPQNEANPFYRSFMWGSDIEIFVLDERSYRSAQSIDDPDVPGACINPRTGEPDLAPTGPRWIRALFSLALAQLKWRPDATCRNSLYDPARTMLGTTQKAWFLAGLESSTARFKLIVNEVPIQEFWAMPYDRWEGYAAEREEILSFVTDKKIKGVVWLTTDSHATYANKVRTDTLNFDDFRGFLFPKTAGQEIVVGPVGTESYSDEVTNVVGSIGPTAIGIVFALTGAKCVNIDEYSYATVTYDEVTKKLNVQPKDGTGTPLCGAGITLQG
ncbi:MAG: alkaline phosphatase D family protein [Acidimicrobiia bacterium]|nr:alkaline phosphatase D family protein [Acidimicrobiia bacterium]